MGFFFKMILSVNQLENNKKAHRTMYFVFILQILNAVKRLFILLILFFVLLCFLKFSGLQQCKTFFCLNFIYSMNFKTLNRALTDGIYKEFSILLIIM